jgi:hypothetical protein
MGLKRWMPLVLVPALLAVAAPAVAQQSRSNPYRNLFKPRELKQVPTQQANLAPRAACGATKVPVNPATDPKVAKDRSLTHYTMRMLCK